MKRSFGDDALLWETGQLSLGELTSRHPGEDAAGLVALFGRLENAADAPASDPEAGWAVLRERLPERLSDWSPAARPVFGDLRGRLRRSLVAASVATAALVGGTSIAYAAGVEPVRHEVDRIVSTISNLFPGHDGDSDGPGTPGVVPGDDQDGVEPAEPSPTQTSEHEPNKGHMGHRGHGSSKHGSHEGKQGNENDQGGARGASQGGQGENQQSQGGSGNETGGGSQGGGGDEQGSNGGGDQGSNEGNGGSSGSGGSGGDQGSDDGGQGGQ